MNDKAIPNDRSTALLTDKYELTMLQAALRDGSANRQVTCEVFGRRLPNERRYGVVAGTERVLRAVEDFRFSANQLAEMDFLDEKTKEYLRHYRFSGQIDGYREGELYFPNSPILTVRGTFGECLILETVILSIMNADSAVASAASRMVTAADGRPIIEMGSRRTHEYAAVTSARAAYLAGFEATSNLEAGYRYGIPVSGTAAHSWTLAHTNPDGTPNEEAAFRSQIETLGVDTTLLVDTYDITKGVETAVKVGGPQLGGVRIDSGDLGAVTRRVRKQLDDLGNHNTNIVVSSDLDEFAIAGLRGDPVDVYGVGTSVATGSGAPTAGMVYKVVEVDGIPVAKRSTSKQSVGGAKRALRTYRSSGVAVEEIVYPFDAPAPDTGQLDTREMTIPLMRDGHIVDELPDLHASREYLDQARKTLPWEGLALSRDEAAVPTRMVGFKK
ncbi:nicotinate phosphoribosyltransferase [Corynebacterium kefirresidentii]|uniref:nicotinate phosphoribosyltransferase n=1 Tax=Corynebacterium TaxID=1716 RepID=UPI00042836D2|nr:MULTISPECIES: nicotinate phosphoribosyltransferase [Corynebacterium]MCK6098652.1 nicotinate phosphoribosyltransferase [Corynebacterium kefirresidentii]MDK8587007.1 nicotinate phosphoribosyltransferase [Corynebacterium kefirresidentii]MDK8600728.1 nicotinate phosphoribosyltransferase [Corynebacterium kefirresidentii]MDK8696757.1 nicotinate phosphoribosyltransferase [Corynebacterium kefirresidentii]MDN8633666.1 nicotinate phosphoribosyltransferase [Corynebacterium kefirresidentii]